MVAGAAARCLGHDYVGPEHLLLALLESSDAAVSSTLKAQRLQPDRVRQMLEDIIGEREHSTTFQMGLTHRSRVVLELARSRARRQHRETLPLDILVAIVEEGESAAARVLKRLGFRTSRVNRVH